MEKTPQYLATKRRQLAQEYNEKMKELAEIQKKKALDIIKLLDEHKTVAKAELYFKATDDGQKEIELTMYCKGLIELMRATKTEIEILNAESFNHY